MGGVEKHNADLKMDVVCTNKGGNLWQITNMGAVGTNIRYRQFQFLSLLVAFLLLTSVFYYYGSDILLTGEQEFVA
jgi:hypothetical protein